MTVTVTATLKRPAGKAIVVVLVAAALFVAASHADAQCAMCRTALESSAEGRALVTKLNLGILLLLAAPFGIAAAVAIAMRKSRRRLRSVEAS
jgi:hypothetical protein